MLPIGAPHNIVMYAVSKIPFESFFSLLLPYVIVSVVFLIILVFFVSKKTITLPDVKKVEVNTDDFFKRVFLGVDYYLLLTFIALFILIGNLEHISFFTVIFKKWIVGNEVVCGIIASQIMSNVPAAMFLSGFSNNFESIIIGINIGGFGTLIASMANLISYKLLVDVCEEFKTKYLVVFTVLNVLLLVILYGVYILTN